MTRPTRWWWIRHAPVPGAPGRLFGQRDVDCDTSDLQSFETLAAILPREATWVISGLARTRQTMEAIAAAGLPVPEPLVEPAFREQNFGRWQGLSWNEMEVADPETYQAFWRNPVHTPPPEGESFVAVMERVREGLERLTLANPGHTMVSVSHGGAIRAVCAAALGLTPEAAMALVIDNLSITRINHVEDRLLRGSGGVWMVRGINCQAPNLARWIR